ncbi:MAG TPA: cytidine deaminase [Bauldia sp.]|nr:cytidine deaminase [Bauldia sp.]
MDRELFEAARTVRERAHAPYSAFPVGAALRTASGNVYAGCNVENASFPEGWCAETTAIGRMVASAEPGEGRRITEVCVVAKAIAGRPIAPCGGCRQRLAEFAGPETPIHCYDPEGRGATWRLGELLPALFELKEHP